MRRLLIALLALFALFVVLRVGWLVPHRHIESEVDGYSGLQKRYASFAVEDAKVRVREWGSLRPPVAAYRVTCVERCPGRPLRCGPPIEIREGVYRENPACEGSPFAVDVRLYTFFGLPAGNANLRCEG
jgi:hypothetical protein